MQIRCKLDHINSYKLVKPIRGLMAMAISYHCSKFQIIRLNSIEVTLIYVWIFLFKVSKMVPFALSDPPLNPMLKLWGLDQKMTLIFQLWKSVTLQRIDRSEKWKQFWICQTSGFILKTILTTYMLKYKMAWTPYL